MGIPAEALLPFIFGNSGGGGASGDSAFIPSIGSLATISTGTSWSGDDPYTSTVTLTGYTVTGNTMVSVLPSSDVIEQMIADGTTNIFISNNNGTLTANAIGAAPTAAMTLHVLCTESDASAELGNLPNIVGDGVLETLQATDLTDAINQLSSDLDDAKNAIEQKQDATSYVTLSGTIVTQTGADNTMYLCGELAELTFTAPATGQTAIRFTSGTTPTVATFSGVTWLNGFDPSAIEASKTYEVNILNGLGCASWT